MTSSGGTLLRVLLAWCATTGGLIAGLAWLGGDALALLGPGAGTEQVLVRGCAAVLLGCAGWAWAVTTLVAAEVALATARGTRPRLRGIPAPVRRVLLGACGVALAGGLAAPATAETGSGTPSGPAPLAGLPMPERAVGGAASRPRVAVVRPGDSLWRLAADTLPRAAPAADVARRTAALHRLNRSRIGPDPDLVLPGQRLLLPATDPKEPR